MMCSCHRCRAPAVDWCGTFAAALLVAFLVFAMVASP